MGELQKDNFSFSSEVLFEISNAFDEVLAECNSYLKNNYFTAVDEVKNNGPTSEITSNGESAPVKTTPCSMCGRKFLPERLVS